MVAAELIKKKFGSLWDVCVYFLSFIVYLSANLF